MKTKALKDLFSEFMTIPDEVDWDTVKYQEIEGWDSVAHMALIGEMEDRLGIMLDTDDVIDLSSFSKAVEILGRYGHPVDD